MAKDDDKHLTPVLLVPGIARTMLHAINKASGERKRVWVRLLGMENNLKEALYSQFDPKTGATMNLNPFVDVEVPKDNHGLYAIENLDPDWLLNLFSSEQVYYGTLTKEMRSWGYEDGKNLFGFGYDFRQSTRFQGTMDDLAGKLRGIYETSGHKVHIVTHSMGGLVVKSFLALHKDLFEKYVESWTAIGCPFQGAPGLITDTVLSGPEFASGWANSLFVKMWTAQQFVVEAPSIFEMIANYDFDWNEVPQTRIIAGKRVSGHPSPVTLKIFNTRNSLFQLFKEALKNKKIHLDGKVFSGSVKDDLLEWTVKTRELWETAELPKGVKFYNVYGVGYDTPFHTSYGSVSKPIDPNDYSKIIDIAGNFLNVDGDGTVPYESSFNDGLSATKKVAVISVHGDMVKNNDVIKFLKEILLT